MAHVLGCVMFGLLGCAQFFEWRTNKKVEVVSFDQLKAEWNDEFGEDR